MLTILTDNFASDAAAERIVKAVSEKKKCILLVPEQETLSTEARYAALLPPDAPLYFEASNFSRLANRVFREKGGICYRYADADADIALMWKTLDAISPSLTVQTKISAGRIRELLAMRAELAASGVGEKALRLIAPMLEKEERLQNKLNDLSETLKIFEGERKTHFGDTVDDLSSLAALLKDSDLFQKGKLFADTLFFIDSFSDFTVPELRVLDVLIRKADVTVCLTLPKNAESYLCYEQTAATARTLLEMADGIQVNQEEAKEYPLTADMQVAREFLFRTDRRLPEKYKPEGSLSLVRGEDPSDAARYVAARIAEEVAKGARYVDFAIVAADSSKYEGILDVALEEQNIPFFLSVPTDLLRFPLVKILPMVLDVIIGGYKREDVLTYLNSGAAAISDEDADRFALYAEFWQLRGKHFKDASPFTLSPRGHTALSDRDREALLRLNATKESLLAPVWQLDAAMKKAATVTERTTALYQYLCHISFSERVKEEAKKSADTAMAKSISRLPAVLYRLFDLLHNLMGETEISLPHFSELFSLLLSSTPLGKLPATADAVTIGNAETLRLHRPRTVFLFGVNEGELPGTSVAKNGFDESERHMLLRAAEHSLQEQKDLGISERQLLLNLKKLSLGNDPVTRASRASFCFLRALTAASEKAMLISFAKSAAGDALRPSAPFSRLEKIFGEAITPCQEIWNKKAATDHLHRLADTPEGAALADLLSQDPVLCRYADMGKEKICDSDCIVSRETASTVFPRDLYTTQSRLDAFGNCPFSYYSRYILGFDPKTNADIGATDIGNMVHGLLEKVFSRLGEGKTIRNVSREELLEALDKVCHAYLKENFAKEVLASPKIHRIFLRLRRAASLLLEDLHTEFANSDFLPVFFELPIGKDGGPDVLAFANEEGEVRLSGTIDRVDIYQEKNDDKAEGEKGNVYFRVIDYKTGNKTFSVKNIQKGRDLQMFLYLCSLWKSKDEAFREKLGVKKGQELIPAGMLYTKAAVTGIQVSSFTEDEKAATLAKKEFTRSGLLLQDEKILRAMDHSLGGHFFPIKVKETKKKGYEIQWDEHFATLSRMGELLGEMESAVLSLVSHMRAGHAAAKPADKKDAGFVVCDSCSYKPFCRKESE